MKKIIIIGATSAIAEETAKLFAERGDRLYLYARQLDRLQFIAKDLAIRGAESVHIGKIDINDFKNHKYILDSSINSIQGADIMLIAYGSLPNQKSCEESFDIAFQELNTNIISVISLLTHIANYFERQQYGTIAVISSVAGDRGRQSNYIYGASKGAITIFLQGLRNRLYKSNVNILTIKPGLVDTPMTKSFKKSLLWASPQQIALDIINSIDKRRDVVYTPWFWQWVMFIIKIVPETIFKKLNL